MTIFAKPGPVQLSDETLAGVTGGTATSGNDTLFGATGMDTRVSGLEGNDIIITRDGQDTVFGGVGDDAIVAGAGDDIALGGAGDDYVYGGNGDDIVAGEAGNDTLGGGSGSDTAFGGDGDDTYLWATNQAAEDVFYGDGGTNAIEVSVILNDSEYGGSSAEVRNTLEGETFAIESETGWELVEGKVVFDGPANGTFTMNGRTIAFTEVSIIKAADLG